LYELLAGQKRSEEGGIRMLCRCGGGMQGEKRKFYLIDEYLYMKYVGCVWTAEVVV
jgi:hypothetical protein